MPLSPTARVLDVPQLYGHCSRRDETDPRPLNSLAGVFDAFVSMRSDTRLDPDLEDLHLSTVKAFHRAEPKCSDSSIGTKTNRSESKASRTGRRCAPSTSSD